MAFGQGRNRNKGVGKRTRCEFRKLQQTTDRRKAKGRTESLLTSMEYVPREEEKIGSAVKFDFGPVFRFLALVQIWFMYFIVAVMLSK